MRLKEMVIAASCCNFQMNDKVALCLRHAIANDSGSMASTCQDAQTTPHLAKAQARASNLKRDPGSYTAARFRRGLTSSRANALTDRSRIFLDSIIRGMAMHNYIAHKRFALCVVLDISLCNVKNRDVSLQVLWTCDVPKTPVEVPMTTLLVVDDKSR